MKTREKFMRAMNRIWQPKVHVDVYLLIVKAPVISFLLGSEDRKIFETRAAV